MTKSQRKMSRDIYHFRLSLTLTGSSVASYFLTFLSVHFVSFILKSVIMSIAVLKSLGKKARKKWASLLKMLRTETHQVYIPPEIQTLCYHVSFGWSNYRTCPDIISSRCLLLHSPFTSQFLLENQAYNFMIRSPLLDRHFCIWSCYSRVWNATQGDSIWSLMIMRPYSQA